MHLRCFSAPRLKAHSREISIATGPSSVNRNIFITYQKLSMLHNATTYLSSLNPLTYLHSRVSFGYHKILHLQSTRRLFVALLCHSMLYM